MLHGHDVLRYEMGEEMSKVRMDGHIVFSSPKKVANWLHATGQTRASNPTSVQGSVNRAVRNGSKAYGHTFEKVE